MCDAFRNVFTKWNNKITYQDTVKKILKIFFGDITIWLQTSQKWNNI